MFDQDGYGMQVKIEGQRAIIGVNDFLDTSDNEILVE